MFVEHFPFERFLHFYEFRKKFPKMYIINLFSVWKKSLPRFCHVIDVIIHVVCVCVPPKSKAPTSFLERKKTKDAGFPRIETACSHLLNSVLQKEKFYIIYQYTGLSLSNYTYVYNDLVRVASTSTFEHVFFLEAVQQQHVWTRHRTAELPACVYEAISRNHAAAEQTKNETPRNNMWHWQIILCVYIYIHILKS